MALSNAKRGAYFKARTRKWLESRGWQVASLEEVRWIHKPGGDRIPVKRDQFASDLLAVSSKGVVFVQVKGGAICEGNGQFPDAQRKFAEFVFPENSAVRLWIVAWAPRSSKPRVIDVAI